MKTLAFKTHDSLQIAGINQVCLSRIRLLRQELLSLLPADSRLQRRFIMVRGKPGVAQRSPATTRDKDRGMAIKLDKLITIGKD